MERTDIKVAVSISLAPVLRFPIRFFHLQRYHVDAGIAHVAQEPVDYRAVKKDVPARPRGLSKNYMGDAFFPGEFNQRISHPTAFELNDSRAQLFGKSNILLQQNIILGIDSARFFFRSLDVDRKPV